MNIELKDKLTKKMDEYINSLTGRKGTLAITSWFNEDLPIDTLALDWVDKDSKELTAELTIGYIIGYITCSLYQLVIVTRRNEKISKIVKESVQDFSNLLPQEQQEILKTDLTSDEIKEIRDLIRSKISTIRKAVYRALSV